MMMMIIKAIDGQNIQPYLKKHNYKCQAGSSLVHPESLLFFLTINR